MIAFTCDADYRIPEPADTVTTCLGDRCRTRPRQGPDSPLGEYWNRKAELVGLDLTLRVGDAWISLYLDDAGHLIIDEWIGYCRMNDAVAALERALRLVDGFRESGQGHES